MKNQSRISGVDTFRFFAFLNVFLFHATDQWSAGYLGVQAFFVLSSFLLTYLALGEIESTGKFSRLNFFVRRSLRIYPLYFLVVATCFYVLPVLATAFHHKITLPESQWKYWLFLSNLDTGEHIFALKFLWSISVEEQFYLLFIAMSFLFRKHIYILIVALLLASFAAPTVSNLTGVSTYYNPLSYTQDFAIGMLAATLYKAGRVSLSLKKLVYLVAGTLIISITAHTASFPAPLAGLSFALFAASLVLLMIILFKEKQHRKWLPAITEKLGGYTYGLYVYSGFVLTFATMLLPGVNDIVLFVLESIALCGIAWISYHLFEKKFLEFKSLARYRTRTENSQPSEPYPALELAPAPIML